MKIKNILKEFKNSKYDFIFDRYDGLPVLFLSKYNDDNYFIYYWTFEDYNEETKKLINAYRVSHLSYKELKEIANKEKPLIHYYLNKETYDSREFYELKIKKGKMEIKKSKTPLDECPPNNYVLDSKIKDHEPLPPKDGSFPFFYGESVPNEDLSSFLF